MYNRFQIYSV